METGSWFDAGGFMGLSATFARHFLQNLSPGLITCPHDRHNRTADGCEGCDSGGGLFREGGGKGDTGETMETGSWFDAGGLMGLSATFARHFLQNLSPGLITCPHDRHNRTADGCEGWDTTDGLFGGGGDEGKEGGTGVGAGIVAGGEEDPGEAAGDPCCSFSPSPNPQAPQNFSSGLRGLPQEAQVRVARGS